MSKQILYIDMDDVLCNYMEAHKKALDKNPDIPYPQSVYGFYTNIEPKSGAIEAIAELENTGLFDIWILTRPSYQNPLCYTEKRVWIEKHLGLEWCKKLILAPDKSLLKGDYLIDDQPWPGFEGVQFLFGKRMDWPQVIEALLDGPMIKSLDGNIITLADQFDVIVHGCNCQSIMGAGLAPQMAAAFGCDRFPMELEGPNNGKLGRIDYQEVRVPFTSRDVYVVNAYTQLRPGFGMQVSYDGIRSCMRWINRRFAGMHIGLPKIGAGLAGGDWQTIFEIITTELKDVASVTIINYKE